MRTDSRSRLRTRFRVTALPRRFDVMKPHRLSERWFGWTMSLTVCADLVAGFDLVAGGDHALPWVRTNVKSRCFLIFSVWFDPHAEPSRRPCALAPLAFALPSRDTRQTRALHEKEREGQAGSDGKPCAMLISSVLYDSSPRSRGHARTKPVPAQPSPHFRLVGSLRHSELSFFPLSDFTITFR